MELEEICKFSAALSFMPHAIGVLNVQRSHKYILLFMTSLHLINWMYLYFLLHKSRTCNLILLCWTI